jgi:AraC-like DNA-binding protein
VRGSFLCLGLDATRYFLKLFRHESNSSGTNQTLPASLSKPRAAPDCLRDHTPQSILRELSSHVSPLPQRVLRRVKDRIDAELTGDLSLSILAEESGYSRTHFQRNVLCSRRANAAPIPPGAAHRARVGLLEKRRNEGLIDIAASCGFSSHSHIDDGFRRLLGPTPGEYRRNRTEVV